MTLSFALELQVKTDAHQDNLEFVFKYAGYSQFSNGTIAPPGQDYIFSGEYQPGIGIRGAEKTFEVCIHAELETLRSLLTNYSEPLPDDVQQILDGQPTQMIYRPSIITPAKQTVLHQLLNCPYQGLVRKLYLESKVLELIALKLESETSDATSSRRSTLRSQDVERIYQARDLLIRYFDNPPSLLNLAKQVGINDWKLKRGFRQVFGTTVFGYLYHHRMKVAQQLLIEKQLIVADVAKAVGYLNAGHFAAAFKKKFGMTPKEFRATERNSAR